MPNGAKHRNIKQAQATEAARYKTPMPTYLLCMGIGDSTHFEEDEVILGYFTQGYTNLEIVAFINDVHGWKISLSTLKRREPLVRWRMASISYGAKETSARARGLKCTCYDLAQKQGCNQTVCEAKTTTELSKKITTERSKEIMNEVRAKEN